MFDAFKFNFELEYINTKKVLLKAIELLIVQSYTGSGLITNSEFCLCIVLRRNKFKCIIITQLKY